MPDKTPAQALSEIMLGMANDCPPELECLKNEQDDSAAALKVSEFIVKKLSESGFDVVKRAA